MAKFYLKFDTMKLIVKASASCSLEDLLHIVCHSAEITCRYLHIFWINY
jgi:ATP-dependent DNA helicase HFM1/MER3